MNELPYHTLQEEGTRKTPRSVQPSRLDAIDAEASLWCRPGGDNALCEGTFDLGLYGRKVGAGVNGRALSAVSDQGVNKIGLEALIPGGIRGINEALGIDKWAHRREHGLTIL